MNPQSLLPEKKKQTGGQSLRVLQVGHCLHPQLSEVRAALPRVQWGDVHHPGLWVQLLLKMEPAIFLSRKDQWGTERKSLENILQNICQRCCCDCPGTEAQSVGSLA